MSDQNTSDPSAFRMFEASQFAPDALYTSKAEYFRDMRLPQYKNDAVFRELADAKLTRSMAANPGFTQGPPKGQKTVSVAVVRDKQGNSHTEIADHAGVHSVNAGNPKVEDDRYNANGTRVTRDPFGNLVVQARSGGTPAKAQAQPKPEASVVSVMVTEPMRRR